MSLRNFEGYVFDLIVLDCFAVVDSTWCPEK